MAYLDCSQPDCSSVQGAVLSARSGGAYSASLQDFGAKVVQYSPHDVVYYEGDPSDRLYELTSGSVMLFKLLPDGRRQVVEVLRPGDIFGLSTGDEQDCTAETLSVATVCALDLQKVEESSEIQRKLMYCLSAQMQKLHEHAVLLGRKSAIERVASFFMYLVPDRGGARCQGPAEEGTQDLRLIVLSMTRQEIADYLGLTIETVSRVISDMRRRGLISVSRHDEIQLNRVCDLCKLTGMH